MSNAARGTLAEATRVLTHPVRLKMMRAFWDSQKGLHFSELVRVASMDERLVGFHLLALTRAGLVCQPSFDVTKPPHSPGTAEACFAATSLSREALAALRVELSSDNKG